MATALRIQNFSRLSSRCRDREKSLWLWLSPQLPPASLPSLPRQPRTETPGEAFDQSSCSEGLGESPFPWRTGSRPVWGLIASVPHSKIALHSKGGSHPREWPHSKRLAHSKAPLRLIAPAHRDVPPHLKAQPSLKADHLKLTPRLKALRRRGGQPAR